MSVYFYLFVLTDVIDKIYLDIKHIFNNIVETKHLRNINITATHKILEVNNIICKHQVSRSQLHTRYKSNFCLLFLLLRRSRGDVSRQFVVFVKIFTLNGHVDAIFTSQTFCKYKSLLFFFYVVRFMSFVIFMMVQ